MAGKKRKKHEHKQNHIESPTGIAKYLGIIEGEEIKHREMKEKIKKEYIKEIESNSKVKTQLWKYCESHKQRGSTSNQVQCSHSGLKELRTLQYVQKDQKSTKYVLKNCTQDKM